MKDSTMQMDAGAGEAALPTELAERLLRRHTEPLGVIDVRRPQQHYARTAGWVAQRFALLDHWKTRYGSDEDAASANAGLVFAMSGQPMAEPSRVHASPTQLAGMVQRADAPQPRAEAVASSSPPEQFRIRRGGVAPAALPQTAALPHGWRNAAAPAESNTATSNSSVSSASSSSSGDAEATATSRAERGEFRVVEIPALTHQATPMPSTLIAPKPLAGSVIAEPETAETAAFSVERSSPRAAPSLSMATALTPSSVHVTQSEAIPSPLALRLQRQSSEATTGLARAQELTAPVVSVPIAHMPWSKSSASQLPPSASPAYRPSLLAGGEDAASEVTNAVSERANLQGIVAPLATIASPASPPLVQRQPAGSARATEIAPGNIVDQRAAIVWRQGTEGSASRGVFAAGVTGGARSVLPLAISAARGGELQVARQTTTAESTSSTRTESPVPEVATPIPAMPPANEIDVAQLAEQVSQLLGRRLEIERERRGMRGWH